MFHFSVGSYSKTYTFQPAGYTGKESSEKTKKIEDQVIVSDLKKNESLEAKRCTFEAKVEARTGLDFENVIAFEVNVNCGPLEWENDESLKFTAKNITARDDITLKNILCSGEIRSNTGNINWNNQSKTDDFALQIEARDDITLQNVNGNVLSHTGEVTASNGLLKKIESHKKCTLRNVTSSKVSVCVGPLDAKDCKLGKIIAYESVVLKRSLGDSIKLQIPAGKEGTIKLKDSEITADIVIEVVEKMGDLNPHKVTPMDSKPAEFNFNGHVIRRTPVKSFNQMGSLFTITVDLSSDLKEMKPTEGSRGWVNGMPYKYENGQFVPTEGYSDDINVKILGNGKLTGRVSIINGEGEVDNQLPEVLLM